MQCGYEHLAASPRFPQVGKRFNISLVSQSLYTLMQFAKHKEKNRFKAGFKGQRINDGLFQIIKIFRYLVIYQEVRESNMTLSNLFQNWSLSSHV